MEITSATIVALLEGGAFLIGAALRAQKGDITPAEMEAILARLGQEGDALRRIIDAALVAERTGGENPVSR